MFNIFYIFNIWGNSDNFSSKSEQNSMKIIKSCKMLPKNPKKFDEMLLKY